MFDSGSPIFDFRFPILGFRFSILGFRFSIFGSRSSTVAFRSCRASARNHRFSNSNFGVSICGFRFSTVGLRHSGAWRLTVNGVTSVDSANRHWVWASTTTSDIRRIGKTTTRLDTDTDISVNQRRQLKQTLGTATDSIYSTNLTLRVRPGASVWTRDAAGNANGKLNVTEMFSKKIMPRPETQDLELATRIKI